MRREWDKVRAMSQRALFVRLGAVGAVAGLAAWLLVVLADMLFGLGKPGGLSLLFAILRGAFFGIILAWVLRAYWNWRSRHNDKQQQL